MNALLNIIVDVQDELQPKGAESFRKTFRQSCPFDSTRAPPLRTDIRERPVLNHSIMYDDASLYYSFNPSAQPQQEVSQLPKHKRKQSVLERPNVSPRPQLVTDCLLMVYAGRQPG